MPQLSKIESLALIDQHEQAFSAERLKGRWTVTNFIFTSCPTICPVMTQRAVALHEGLSDLKEQVQFVSISVDPEADTPKVLRRYAVAQGAQYDNWWFLTGETEKIGAIAQQSFKVAVGEKVAREEGYDILHASHFILVDPNATIRGYYSNDADGMDSLERDVRREIGR